MTEDRIFQSTCADDDLQLFFFLFLQSRNVGHLPIKPQFFLSIFDEALCISNFNSSILMNVQLERNKKSREF